VWGLDGRPTLAPKQRPGLHVRERRSPRDRDWAGDGPRPRIAAGDEKADEQRKTGHKPEGNEALPAVVDGRTVVRVREEAP